MLNVLKYILTILCCYVLHSSRTSFGQKFTTNSISVSILSSPFFVFKEIEKKPSKIQGQSEFSLTFYLDFEMYFDLQFLISSMICRLQSQAVGGLGSSAGGCQNQLSHLAAKFHNPIIQTKKHSSKWSEFLFVPSC